MENNSPQSPNEELREMIGEKLRTARIIATVWLGEVALTAGAIVLDHHLPHGAETVTYAVGGGSMIALAAYGIAKIIGS